MTEAQVKLSELWKTKTETETNNKPSENKPGTDYEKLSTCENCAPLRKMYVKEFYRLDDDAAELLDGDDLDTLSSQGAKLAEMLAKAEAAGEPQQRKVPPGAEGEPKLPSGQGRSPSPVTGLFARAR